MRTVRALLVSAALAAGLVSIATAPAHAESIRYAYYLQEDCYNGGRLGIQWGWWTSFRCEWGVGGGNFWFLIA